MSHLPPTKNKIPNTSTWLVPRPTDEIIALSDYNKLYRRKLRWGVESIDEKLRGGLLSGLIYEISGESGSGKTQAALTLTAQVVLSHFRHVHETINSYVYFIFTTGTFPVHRLREILESRLSSTLETHSRELTHDDKNKISKDLMDNIFLEKVTSQQGLLDVLDIKLQKLFNNFETRLVVIDSIAHLFRTGDDFNSQGLLHLRSSMLFRISSILRRIASEFQAWIIIINEVSVVPESYNLNSNIEVLRPSLGLSWSNCIDCRILLSKPRFPGNFERNKRYFNLSFAPNASPGEVPFIINEKGIQSFSKPN